MASSLKALRRLTLALLAAAFILTLATGILKFPELNKLTSGLVLPFNYITLVHDWAGIAFAAFIIIHVLLHWGPVVSRLGGGR